MKIKAKVVSVLFILLAFMLYLFFDIKKVKGNSMNPYIKDGEYLVIFRLEYGLKLPWKNSCLFQWKRIEKNDVVLYRIDNRFVVKRVFLTSGDKLQYTEKNGEKYLLLDKFSVKLTSENFRNIFANGLNETVPKNTFFALGDNLKSSEDSRHYGFVSNESVSGKILCK